MEEVFILYSRDAHHTITTQYPHGVFSTKELAVAGTVESLINPSF